MERSLGTTTRSGSSNAASTHPEMSTWISSAKRNAGHKELEGSVSRSIVEPHEVRREFSAFSGTTSTSG
jgi:hypothetical protein